MHGASPTASFASAAIAALRGCAWAEQGASLSSARYGWDRAGELLEALYSELVARKAAAR